jgi:hypothetical protein
MAVKLGKRHLQIAIGLVLLSVACGLVVFIRRGAEPESVQRGSAPVSQPGVPAASRHAAVDPMRIPAPPVVDLENEPVWSRDPFLAAGESRRATVQVAGGVAEPASPDPVITSILYAADRRLAVIDRRTLRVGDSVGAGVIADIQRNAVVIRSPSGKLRRVEMTKTLAGGRATAPGVSRSK